eukprot:scaffold310381_cov26-Tisochrysis_lutea.AAC.4
MNTCSSGIARRAARNRQRAPGRRHFAPLEQSPMWRGRPQKARMAAEGCPSARASRRPACRRSVAPPPPPCVAPR